MSADREALSGVYRFTSIARPVDPAYPTNRALLYLLPSLAVLSAVIAWQTGIGGGPAAAAINTLLVGFVSWALTRELSPDDNAAAFLALAIAWPIGLFLGASSVLLVFAVLFLVRIVNRSTGLAARTFDSISVLGLSIWVSYSMQLPVFLLVAALAFLLDALLKDGHRLHLIDAAICAGVFAWFGAGKTLTNVTTTEDWMWFGAIAVACGLVMATTRAPVSVGDVSPERLSATRVNAGLGIGLLAGAQLLLSEGSSVWISTPLFACLVAVPISFGMSRLLSFRNAR